MKKLVEKKERRKKITKKIINIIVNTIYIISLVLFFLVGYINLSFEGITIEQLLYSIQTAEGTSDSVLVNGIVYIIPRVLGVIIIFLVLKLVISYFVKTTQILTVSIRNKNIKLNLIFSLKVVLSVLVLLVAIKYVDSNYGIFSYFNSNNTSEYIDENYVDPKDVSITSPSKKPNLIYIYVESLESSFFSDEFGGNFKTSVIPNLERLAKENVSFSDTDTLGGAYVPFGSTWTIAGMVASSAAVPLKLPFEGQYYSDYKEFLPGVYNLGDVLKENDYNNYLLLGSDANFGGRSKYYSLHGDYKIYDYYSAIDDGWIGKNYYKWWGYEDKKLFSFAKKILSEIKDNKEPFNLTLLTADTHFTDGYMDDTCENIYDQKYLNSYNCSDKKIGQFIEWIKKQDFYEDTVIVIVGDHLSMQGSLPDMFDSDDNERKLYNVFINSKQEDKNTKQRLFTTFDLYPTTLAALGFEIEGDRLGLGTNLYSDQKTLLEQSDYSSMNEQLSKRSSFYDNKLLK